MTKPAGMTVGGWAKLIRLTWMLLGNVALFILGLSLCNRERWSGSYLDIAYWTLVVGLLVLRYIDITRLGGRTVFGEPATLRNFRIYALLLTGVSVAGWLVAHLISLS